MSELIKSINRNGHYTLAQKRILKDIISTSEAAINSIEVSTPDPVQLYGGALLYGTVTWLTGLWFDVSDCGYIIDGTTYYSEATQVALATADSTHPRIDVIYVDSGGLVGVTTGTAAADPAKPEVDPGTQLELTFVTVAASATTPSDISAGDLYAENAGDTAEWDATESTSTARIALASTADPYAGTKSILYTAAVPSDRVTLTDGGGSSIVIADMESLETHIKVGTWGKKDSLRVAWFEGANRISSWVSIKDKNYGFKRDMTDTYQTVTIPKADFQLSAGTPDSLAIEVGDGTITAHLDQVRIQTGSGVTIINNYTGLTEEELINNVRTWNVQQPFDAGALTDGATITWNLDTDPVATIELGGNRTINFTNARAGGTYIIRVKQDVTGTRLVTWNSAIFWPGGTAPTLSTVAADIDVFTFVAFDSTNLLGATAGLDFS